jgi:arabinogalactan endo-1,4-beta-galactosidase
VVKAKRAKELGMRLMLDFHYSDDWANPGKQPKPKAWETLTFDKMKVALFDYTKGVMDTLKLMELPQSGCRLETKTMMACFGKKAEHQNRWRICRLCKIGI